MTLERLRVLALDRGGALALLAGLYYIAFASRHIIENDSAEFATLGAVGGVGHPSGFPAFVLWLRLWSWLPVAPAHAASIATALLAIATVVVLHAACRAWGARPATATAAVGFYATAPFVIRYATQPDVFALNNLVVGLVVWVAAVGAPVKGVRRAALLGLVAGLGLANNLTCVLVMPIGVLGVVRAARETTPVRAIGIATFALGIGLLPYVYVFVAPDNPMSWKHPRDFGELLHLFLRRDYGSSFSTGFVPTSDETLWLAQVRELAHVVARSWLWLPFLGSLVAIARRIVRPPAGEPRASWIALLASALLAGPILVAQFDRSLDEVGTWLAHRFCLMPIALLVVAVAMSFDDLARLVRAVPSWVTQARVHAALLLAVSVLLLARVPELRRFQSPAMEYEVRNTLESLPSHAVVFGSIDELDVGIRYLQLARGLRPDVVFVRWEAMVDDWYRSRFAKYGLDAIPPGPAPLNARLASQVLSTGQPLFVSQGQAIGLEAFPKYPYGILIRVLPQGSARPSIDEVVALNRELFARFDLAYSAPGPDDEFATWMHNNYARVWRTLGQALAANGNEAAATEAFAVARQLAPWTAP